MSDWMNWLVIAGVMIVLELFSGTFYLLMISLGLVAAALVAFLGLTREFQVITAALVGAVATILLRRSKLTETSNVDANRDPNVNLDIGQTIQVNEWQSSSDGVQTARAMHRGALWSVECAAKGVAEPGMYKIIEIRGSQLIVERVERV